jgi:hypothetical protein
MTSPQEQAIAQLRLLELQLVETLKTARPEMTTTQSLGPVLLVMDAMCRNHLAPEALHILIAQRQLERLEKEVLPNSLSADERHTETCRLVAEMCKALPSYN